MTQHVTVEIGSMTYGLNCSPCDSGRWVSEERGELGLTV